MSKSFELIKIMLKSNFFSAVGVSTKSKKQSKPKLKGKLLIILISVLILFSVSFPIGYGAYAIIKEVEIDISQVALNFVIPTGAITSIFFGVFSMITIFYLNKNTQSLLSLPISSKDLFISNFIIALLSNYFILFLFIFPFLFGIGFGIGAHILYYLYSIIVFLLLPIIPLVLVCIIILFISKYFNFAKYKDKFMYFATAIIIAISLVYSFGSQYLFSSRLTEQMMSGAFGDLNDLFTPQLRKIFFLANSGTDALVNFNNAIGFFALMTYIGLNLVFLILIYFIGDKLYIKGITKTFGTPKKKAKPKKQVYRSINNNGILRELIKKDFVTILRTPIYMLNLIVVSFIVPIIMFLSYVISAFSEGESMFGEILNIGEQTLANPSIFLGVIIAFLFLSSTSAIAVTAITREGKNAWFMKSIPVGFLKQVNAKVLFANIFDILSTSLLGIVVAIVLKVPLTYLLMVMIPLFVTIILLNYLSIIIDLKRPNLKWNSEQEAVKQNFNVFFGMLLTLFFCVLFGLGIFLINHFNIEISIFNLSSSLTLIAITLILIVVSLLKRKEEHLFDKIG